MGKIGELVEIKALSPATYRIDHNPRTCPYCGSKMALSITDITWSRMDEVDIYYQQQCPGCSHTVRTQGITLKAVHENNEPRLLLAATYLNCLNTSPTAVIIEEV